MRFKEAPNLFSALGDRTWGALVRGRYSFCIVFTVGIGYSATWSDVWDPEPRQVNRIVKGVGTFAAAERACREQEKRLRPN